MGMEETPKNIKQHYLYPPLNQSLCNNFWCGGAAIASLAAACARPPIKTYSLLLYIYSSAMYSSIN
eukprot:scaffold87995_cov87-Attheya_sp.AAC.1